MRKCREMAFSAPIMPSCEDLSIFIAFAENNLDVAKMATLTIPYPKHTEEENTDNQHFSLCPHVFYPLKEIK